MGNSSQHGKRRCFRGGTYLLRELTRKEVNEAAEGQNNADGNFSWWCCRCRGWDIRDRNGIESVYPCFCGWYLEQHYRSICLLSTDETHGHHSSQGNTRSGEAGGGSTTSRECTTQCYGWGTFGDY